MPGDSAIKYANYKVAPAIAELLEATSPRTPRASDEIRPVITTSHVTNCWSRDLATPLSGK